MRVISYRKLREFAEAHPSSKSALDAWHKVAKKAVWKNLAEVKQTYPHADLVGRFTVFNIGGNKFRLVVDIHYRTQTIFIKGVLTHKEYDKDSWKT